MKTLFSMDCSFSCYAGKEVERSSELDLSRSENKNNKKISYNPFPGINQASAGQISAFKANSGEEVRVQTEGSRNESSDSVCALERKFPANKEAINRLAQKEINLDKYEKKVGNALEDKDRTTKRVLGVYDIFSRAPRGIYLASNRDSVTNNRGFIISYSSNGLGQVNEMIERVTMVCGTEAPNSLFEFFVVNSDPNSSDNEPYTIRQGDDEKKIEQNYSSKVLTVCLKEHCAKLGVQDGRLKYYLKQTADAPSSQTAIVGIPMEYFDQPKGILPKIVFD